MAMEILQRDLDRGVFIDFFFEGDDDSTTDDEETFVTQEDDDSWSHEDLTEDSDDEDPAEDSAHPMSVLDPDSSAFREQAPEWTVPPSFEQEEQEG